MMSRNPIYVLSQSLGRSSFFPDIIQLNDSNLFDIFKNIAPFFYCLIIFNFSYFIFRKTIWFIFIDFKCIYV